MTDYKNVRYKFPTVTLSGATEASPAEGDIWYNSGKFHLGTSQTFAGAWSSGGNLSVAKYGPAGAGTQTAGLCIGGYYGGPTTTTEEYDGTSWSGGGNMATARHYLGGCGTQDAALAIGGWTGSYASSCEEYNGASWSAGGSLAAAKIYLAGAGTQTAGLALGGDVAGTRSSRTEEYD